MSNRIANDIIVANNTKSIDKDCKKISFLFFPERDKTNEKQRDNKTSEFIISLNTAKYILTDSIKAVIRISIRISGRMKVLIN